MPRSRFFLLFLISTSIIVLAARGQTQPQPSKLQTARQALIEVVSKGTDGLSKHLTVEVQSLMKAKGQNLPSWGIYTAALKGLQSFESGDVLFAYADSAQKFEVHVDSDDLAGDEDNLSLSIHVFRGDKEQDSELGLMSSHFTVSMKLQQNIWRLNKISVGAEFPVGDAKFVEKTLFKSPPGETAAGFLPEPHTEVTFAATTDSSPPPMAPNQVVTMLGYAESTFAALHPDVGFTCVLGELSQWSTTMGVDEQVITGAYNGYKFALSGCEGKPSGSFQITAEPLVAGKGAKAFCTDATHNVRESEDGQGAACLASGKVRQAENEGVEGVTFTSLGVDAHAHPKE